MDDKDFEKKAKNISDLCSREPAIEAVYLFGSIVTGKGKPSSDIDIAILLNDAYLEKFSLLSFISLLEQICGCPADVVILNRAGEFLKYEVRRTGCLIFERDSNKRKQFEVKGRKTYEDFLYLHKRYVGTVLYGESHG